MDRTVVAGRVWWCFAVGVVVLCCASACQDRGRAPAGSDRAAITVRGSTSLAPLVEKWAAAFGEQAENVVVDVIGTGSSEGIDDLVAGRADIAMASRPMSPEESATASQAGLETRETVVAWMGIGVIVNVANPVSAITFAQVGDIFSGDVRNWQSVSGPDEAIVVVRKILGWSPDFFRRKVLGDREFAAEAVKVEHTEEVVAEVSRQPWAVGFSDLEKSIPAQDQIRLLRLVDDTSGEDATYAMRRPLFFFTRADSPQVQAFVDFVLGSDAQAKTFEVGLYPAQEADSVPDR